MKNTKVSAVQAKREFAEILGRVATGSETFTIIRRGKPVAVLSPTPPSEGLKSVKGWLDNNDSFFREINKIINDRKKHRVRSVRLPAF